MRACFTLADILNVLDESAGNTLLSDNFYSLNCAKPARYILPLRAMLGVKFSF